MKVACPRCGWSAEVPEEKMPVEGRNATCPKCKKVFEVKREETSALSDYIVETSTPTVNAEKTMLDCPKCGVTQETSEICISCGIVFSKYINAQRKKEAASVVEQVPSPQPDVNATIKAFDKVVYTVGNGIFPESKLKLANLQLSLTNTGLDIKALNDGVEFGRFYPLYVIKKITTSTELWVLHIKIETKTAEHFKINLINGDEKKRFKDIILPYVQAYIKDHPEGSEPDNYKNDVINTCPDAPVEITEDENGFKGLELTGIGVVTSCILNKHNVILRRNKSIIASGELVLPISQIASVMLNGQGLTGPAIIFAPTGFTGYRPPKTIFEAIGDYYSVAFDVKSYDIAAKMRDYIVTYDAKSKSEVSQASSPVDEILKYKNLFDDGVLTEDEFMAKKKQLLGI